MLEGAGGVNWFPNVPTLVAKIIAPHWELRPHDNTHRVCAVHGRLPCGGPAEVAHTTHIYKKTQNTHLDTKYAPFAAEEDESEGRKM